MKTVPLLVLPILLLAACSKPSTTTVASMQDRLLGTYTGPDTTFSGPSGIAVRQDTMVVRRSDLGPSYLNIDSQNLMMLVQPDGSVLCGFGNDRLPADAYFYTFYPALHRLVYHQELQYIDSTVLIRRAVLDR